MFNVQTVECFDTFKEEWRRVASMDIGRILPGIAILSGQVAFIMTALMVELTVAGGKKKVSRWILDIYHSQLPFSPAWARAAFLFTFPAGALRRRLLHRNGTFVPPAPSTRTRRRVKTDFRRKTGRSGPFFHQSG